MQDLNLQKAETHAPDEIIRELFLARVFECNPELNWLLFALMRMREIDYKYKSVHLNAFWVKAEAS